MLQRADASRVRFLCFFFVFASKMREKITAKIEGCRVAKKAVLN